MITDTIQEAVAPDPIIRNSTEMYNHIPPLLQFTVVVCLYTR